VTPGQLLRLLLTVLGIYFIGFALPQLIFAASLFRGATDPTENEYLTMWMSIVVPVLYIAFGVSLVLFRGKLSSRLEPHAVAEPISSLAASIHVVGISIVGAFFLVQGAADIGGAIVLGLFYRSLSVFETGLVRGIAQFFFGLAVFFGAPGVVGLWRTLRSRGPQPSE